MEGKTKTTYRITTPGGPFFYDSLEDLGYDLEQFAYMNPIRRIVKITQKEIPLPDFVAAFNKKCRGG